MSFDRKGLSKRVLESEAWVANYFITVTEPFLSYYCEYCIYKADVLKIMNIATWENFRDWVFRSVFRNSHINGTVGDLIFQCISFFGSLSVSGLPDAWFWCLRDWKLCLRLQWAVCRCMLMDMQIRPSSSGLACCYHVSVLIMNPLEYRNETGMMIKW